MTRASEPRLLPTVRSGDRATAFHVLVPAAGVTISFQGCPVLAREFLRIGRCWQAAPVEARTGRTLPQVTIRRGPGGYEWVSSDRPPPLLWRQERVPRTIMDALCDLHDVLIDWYLAAHPRHLCLHAAAIEMAGGLVVMPCVGKSGKSTLTVALAARGWRIFGDDVLALAPRASVGRSLGLLPRLRLPLPANVSQAIGGFLAARPAPIGRSWQYVGLEAGEVAGLDEACPIKALMFLERRATGAASLAPVAPAEAMQELVLQNIARGTTPVRAFDRLLHFLAGTKPMRLTYASLTDACRLLEHTCGTSS